MGFYGGTEICELVGLFILNHSGKKFGKKNIGWYRDDGLAIIKNRSARLADKTRKELLKVFEQFFLKITAEANLHVVNFLHLTFDLATGKYKPYRKPNDEEIIQPLQILIYLIQNENNLLLLSKIIIIF